MTIQAPRHHATRLGLLALSMLAACSSDHGNVGGTGGNAGTSSVASGGRMDSAAGGSVGGSGGTAGIASTGMPSGGTGGSAGAQLPGWTLAWSDEFDAPDATPPDPSHFHHEIGGDGWGNNELEYYTADNANSEQRGGNLVITATTDGASQYMCQGAPCQYTSARLITKDLFSFTYGRVEARIRMPTGKGIWPAFWMLGQNIDAVSWPTCGEIDIMETIGTDSTHNHGSMHGPGYSGGSPLTATYALPGGGKFSDDFHVYAIEWAANVVRFYVDDHLYETRTPSDLPPGKMWVYDHPFFLLLNVAVGGSWPGSPDTSTVFPAQMLVDYVRVYRAN